jgi:uncharacterized membrane-anchored protein
MKLWSMAALAVALTLPASARAQAPEGVEEAAPADGEAAAAAPAAAKNPLDEIDWVRGPGKGTLASGLAELAVPEGYRFTGPAGTRRMMELTENLVTGREAGFIAPESFDWFVVFEFDPIGYVKDDEKDDLDAEALLSSIREGTEAANVEMQKRGWPTLEILGWERPPAYDPGSHDLTWATKAKSSASEVLNVNYNTRLLGRTGVMKVVLVVDQPDLVATLPTYNAVLQGFGYTEGNRYAEYREGDKMAEYGLAALVVGGAGAVAAKTGLLAKLGKGVWKLLIVGGAAIAGLFKKLFGKKDEASWEGPGQSE